MMTSIISRAGIFLGLCAAVVASQQAYDASRASYAVPNVRPSAVLVRALDLSLHTAAASFFWLDIRPELPFLPAGPQHFLAGLRLVNDLDPRWSTPYAFSVLVLPAVRNFPDRVAAALAAGERGLAQADPDWQIPFYMATTYQLELSDRHSAVKYFDLAAHTPGIPETVRRFAINYGIRPERLAETKAIWGAIYASSRDPVVRERAAAHIAHLEILEYLNAAAQAFHGKYDQYPASVDDLVRAGIIAAVPPDPFGFAFKIYEGGIVGIAP